MTKPGCESRLFQLSSCGRLVNLTLTHFFEALTKVLHGGRRAFLASAKKVSKQQIEAFILKTLKFQVLFSAFLFASEL